MTTLNFFRKAKPKIVFACVTDNKPKYMMQTLNWILSIRWSGGSYADSDILVCAVAPVDPDFAAELERQHIQVHCVERFSAETPCANKLALLEWEGLRRYDQLVMLDTDTLLVRNIDEFLSQSADVQAKIADLPTVPEAKFRDLFAYFKMPLPQARYRCSFDGTSTILYCNSGVLLFNLRRKKTWLLFEAWRDFARQILSQRDVYSLCGYFCDLAALTLAMAKLAPEFKELPVGMNFPLHLQQPAQEKMLATEPLIVHYHHLLNAGGYIATDSPYALANARIAEFNRQLGEARRQQGYVDKVYWNYRYDEYGQLGSGWGSRGEPGRYKREIVHSLLQWTQARSILDVGCGDQQILPTLPPGVDYHGIDFSQVVIDRSRRTFPDRCYTAGDFLAIDLSASDAVFCMDVLIHAKDKAVYAAIVAKAIRLAKHCGLISGYDALPNNNGDITYYHEPLADTLRQCGAKHITRIGGYRSVALYYFGDLPWLGRQENPGDESAIDQPLFILGTMRSGTTLLADLLGSHEEIVYVPFELREAWSAAGVPMASPKTQDRICEQLDARDIAQVDVAKLKHLFAEAYHTARKEKDTTALFLCKNPHLCNKLPLVDAIFPQARYIWILRHPLQVVNSLRRLFERVHAETGVRHYWPSSLGAASRRCWQCVQKGDAMPEIDAERFFPGGNILYLAEYWLESNQAIQEFLPQIPAERRIMLREEQVLADVGGVLSSLCAFLQVTLPERFSGVDVIETDRNRQGMGTLSENEQSAFSVWLHKQEPALTALLGKQETKMLQAFFGSDQNSAASLAPHEYRKLSTLYGPMLVKSEDMIARQMEEYGGHTRPELAMVLALLKPGAVVLDAGAHIGSFAIPLAQKVGKSGKVMAFEPDPENYALLCRNSELNGVSTQLQPFNGIVTHQPGRYRKNQFMPSNTGTYFFLPAEDISDPVQCYRLDDQAGDRVDLIKIDVEGMELSVLQSARNTIRHCRPLLYIEINQAALERAGVCVAELQEYLRENNYSTYRNIGPRNDSQDCYQIASVPDLELEAALSVYDVLAIPAEKEQAYLALLGHERTGA